jgi:O-succinylbenzoate synthase
VPVELSELLSTAHVVSLPLRSRFRGLIERELLLFEGPNGWAEWSPFTEYPDAEASVWLAAAIEFGFGASPVELRDKIGVNATLPAVAAAAIPKVLNKFGSFRTVKIKVAEAGQSRAEDLARAIAVRDLYPTASIRLDANGGLSVAEALELIGALRRADLQLEYFEQPVATLEEMLELGRALKDQGDNTRLAADELVRKASDPIAVAKAGAADILVLKAAPLGGVARAIEIAGMAKLPVVVSSALESSVGLSMGMQLAACLPDLTMDSGLGTAALLAGDVTRDPLLPEDGWLSPRKIEVDAGKLQLFAAEDHRGDWWIERLERCFKLYSESGIQPVQP